MQKVGCVTCCSSVASFSRRVLPRRPFRPPQADLPAAHRMRFPGESQSRRRSARLPRPSIACYISFGPLMTPEQVRAVHLHANHP